MYYVRINEIDYPANFTGKQQDSLWDNRATKTIHTSSFTLETALEMFHDDMEWYIVEKHIELVQKVDEDGEPMYDDEGNPIMEEVEKETAYSNSEYSMRGDVTIHPDNSISIVMGKLTDLEEAYELLYGGE